MKRIKSEKIIVYSVFFFVLMFVSCDTSLNEELKSDLSEATLTSEKDAVALVDGVYNGLLDGGWGYYGSGVLARATDGITDVFNINDVHYRELETYNWTNDDIAAPLWKSIYKMIDRANWAIKIIGNMDEVIFSKPNLKNQLLAEASFLRALAYFDLTGMFGGVPLKTEPTDTDAPGFARSSVEEVYAQIEKDLQFAIDNLPVETGTPGKASKGAAYGLLAKVQLRQLKWEEAEASINSLIGLGEYDLFTEDSYLKLFCESHVKDNEFIFSAMSLGESYNIASNHHIKFFTPWNYDAGWATVGLPKYIYQSIEADDARLQVYLDNYPFLYGGTIKSALNDYGFAINRKFGAYNRDVTAPGSGYAAYHNYGISKLGVPVIRYADILLLKADIENHLHGPTAEAYSAINQVRNRAGLANLPASLSKEQFTQAVLKERAIELAGEGQRKDDLIRHGIFETTMTDYLSRQGYPKSVTKDYELLPIPRTELELNPNMKPNPSNDF